MKNMDQKNNKRRVDEVNDFSSLNSELGSFDLEPPRHYREETKQQQKPAPKKKPLKTKKEKQIAQKKRSKRSKLFNRVATIVLLAVSIIAVLLILLCTVFCQIDKIEVQGNKKYSTQEIISVLPIEKGKNLVVAKTASAEEALEQYLPYVFNAEIHRKFPSTLVVEITETPKVYSIRNEDKSYILLDENLKVLEATAVKKPKKCVAIKGVMVTSVIEGEAISFENEKTTGSLLAMTGLINSMKLDEITSLTSVDVNTNSLMYERRIEIMVGSVDKLENKLYSALTAIEKLNESDPNAKGKINATNVKQVYFTEE